jgi:hypothetical protein
MVEGDGLASILDVKERWDKGERRVSSAHVLTLKRAFSLPDQVRRLLQIGCDVSARCLPPSLSPTPETSRAPGPGLGLDGLGSYLIGKGEGRARGLD